MNIIIRDNTFNTYYLINIPTILNICTYSFLYYLSTLSLRRELCTFLYIPYIIM